MSFARIRPSGQWIFETTVDPEEWEQFDENQSLAVDSRGGTYAPTNPIVFGGAGLRLEVTPTNELDVTPKFYVDGEIDDALNYIDDEVEDLTTYVNAQDAATLASANAYSD